MKCIFSVIYILCVGVNIKKSREVNTATSYSGASWFKIRSGDRINLSKFIVAFPGPNSTARP